MGAFCGKIRLVHGPHTLQYAPARTVALCNPAVPSRAHAHPVSAV